MLLLRISRGGGDGKRELSESKRRVFLNGRDESLISVPSVPLGACAHGSTNGPGEANSMSVTLIAFCCHYSINGCLSYATLVLCMESAQDKDPVRSSTSSLCNVLRDERHKFPKKLGKKTEPPGSGVSRKLKHFYRWWCSKLRLPLKRVPEKSAQCLAPPFQFDGSDTPEFRKIPLDCPNATCCPVSP